VTVRKGAGAAALVIALSAAAADPVAMRSLFPSEADVFAGSAGLTRLDLPPEVVAACRPDLSDLRLFDPAGNEIPFLLDAPARVAETEHMTPRIVEVRREELPIRDARPRRRETYELAGPEKAAPWGEWVVVLDVPAATFVAAARVAVTPAGGGPARVVDGSVFRLASPRAVEKVRIPIGAAAAARVSVSLEHEGGSWLQPGFRIECARSFESGGRLAIPLAVSGTRAEGHSTVVLLSRPRGIVPAALRVSSSTPTFDREVTVFDEGPGRGPARLGRRSVFRLASGTGVEDLVVPLTAARGDRIRVVIDDGDSPPLADLAFTAVFDRPSLVAPLAASSGEAPAAVLCFGGGRARVPRYDLAGFRAEPGRQAYGERAEALVRLYDPTTVGIGHLGPVRANPAFDKTPALQFAMRPGASIDARVYAMRRSLPLRPSPEGLARVRLSPDDLAALRGDLADLRIVDGASHQWPYLLDRDAATTEIPLAVASATSKSGATTYRLEPAATPVALDRVTLESPLTYFDRAFRLIGETPDRTEVVLATGRLARAAGDMSPVAIDVPRKRVRSLELVVEDGDDAPLALRSVRARVPVDDVYLAAPQGDYVLLLGSPDAAPPRYEIERARDVVLAVQADENRPGPLEKNSGFRATARLAQGRGPQQAALWAALIVAVVGLAGFTLYLARRPS
jgi:hypothetical protein